MVHVVVNYIAIDYMSPTHMMMQCTSHHMHMQCTCSAHFFFFFFTLLITSSQHPPLHLQESNEMEAAEILHFMCEDDMSFSRWLSSLAPVLSLCRDIQRINAEIVHSRGTTNVKEAIAESSKK